MALVYCSRRLPGVLGVLVLGICPLAFGRAASMEKASDLVGISFLDNPDSTYRFIGIAAIVVFIRIEMGSPFETVLTDESRQRWRARQRLAKWEDGVLDETKKDDTL